ncbi:MAG: VCBS repeat-containing protein [Chitinophagaceae bacterium]|nr:VCBS repeat-containing protein [Chitinophagaceae bacterium]
MTQSRPVFLFLILAIIASLGACKQEQAPVSTLFTLETNTGIRFTNTVTNTKDFNIFSYRNFYNGGGAAIGDINNDGLSDVFFTGNMSANKLFVNKGDFKFDDISGKAGITGDNQWNTGVVMVDINSDGWLDIYVCNAGYANGNIPKSKLYINNRNLTFSDSAEAYGLANAGGYATHAAFFDYDLDGDLDAFIINNSFIPVNTLNYANKRLLRAKDWAVADFLKGGGDRFLRNDKGKFIDISEQAGIYGSLISFGLGVTVGDINGDHYPDVYVSNDFFERDYLYINQKNGTFKDELEQRINHVSHSSMGADLGDINNDGHPDLFVTEMLPDDDYRLKTTTSFENTDVQRLKVSSGFYYQFMQNTLQVNNRSGRFMETAYFSGVAASDWSWGGLIFDADNDGLSDIFVCNGIYHDVTNQDFIDFFANDVIQKMMLTGKKEQVDEIINKMPSVPIPNKAFRNLGNLKFTDSALNWGFEKPSFSNGAAYGDLDNDGDLDLIINNVNEEAFVYRNNSREQNANNYIGLQLKGIGQNTFAVGSVVKLYQGSSVFTRELIPSRGFQSSVDYKIVVGLGKGTIDSIRIFWPDQTYSTLRNPAINTVHVIAYEKQQRQLNETVSTTQALLAPQKQEFDKHQEDDFIDSYYDRNIPLIMSREGPRAAVGDVNGDGLDDVFIGGARKQAGKLYLQTGSFLKSKLVPDFDRFTEYEDVASLFFDCDKDGDLDLFVGSGGNNRDSGSKELQNRLFRNDGKGNFRYDSLALPPSGVNCALAAANDFDGDGDLDLFVGSRSLPLNYGPSPSSFLLQNNGNGIFSDVTASMAPALVKPGLITGAVWQDVAGDKTPELIITGEWMSPQIFSFSDSKVQRLQSNLDSLLGWWQTISSADIDGDGDVDLLLGNIGENFYLRPDASHPVKMWINDFDRNGNVEKVLTKTIGSADVPVFLKRDLTDQVVSLKKQNLKYDQYGRKSIQQLFTPAMIQGASVKTFNFSSSIIALNEGNGQFKIVPMTTTMQLSSVNSIMCKDLNGDGMLDIIAGGNRFDLLPQFGRLDASFGHVLINKGNARFEELPSTQSGLILNGQVRDIIEIKKGKARGILILQNNEFPLHYRVKDKNE